MTAVCRFVCKLQVLLQGHNRQQKRFAWAVQAGSTHSQSRCSSMGRLKLLPCLPCMGAASANSCWGVWRVVQARYILHNAFLDR